MWLYEKLFHNYNQKKKTTGNTTLTHSIQHTQFLQAYPSLVIGKIKIILISENLTKMTFSCFKYALMNCQNYSLLRAPLLYQLAHIRQEISPSALEIVFMTSQRVTLVNDYNQNNDNYCWYRKNTLQLKINNKHLTNIVVMQIDGSLSVEWK